jgi:hypothetical protein
MTLRVELMMAM